MAADAMLACMMRAMYIGEHIVPALQVRNLPAEACEQLRLQDLCMQNGVGCIVLQD